MCVFDMGENKRGLEDVDDLCAEAPEDERVERAVLADVCVGDLHPRVRGRVREVVSAEAAERAVGRELGDVQPARCSNRQCDKLQREAEHNDHRHDARHAQRRTHRTSVVHPHFFLSSLVFQDGVQEGVQKKGRVGQSGCAIPLF